MRQELAQLGNGAHALATQILGSREDAADAVHDAYATVLARPDAYDSARGAFKPWFLRIVRNRCIDLIRRRQPSGVDIDLIRHPGATPDERLEMAERDRGLQTALAALDPGKRQILLLRDFLDLSYAEIAAVLDIVPGTVMSRLHRARLALKQQLELSHE